MNCASCGKKIVPEDLGSFDEELEDCDETDGTLCFDCGAEEDGIDWIIDESEEEFFDHEE